MAERAAKHLRTGGRALVGCVLLLSAVAANAQPPGQPSPQLMDDCRVLARVNGQVIVSCDVLWQVNLILEENEGRIPPDKLAEVREHLTRQQVMLLIDMRIAYADFRASVPEVDMGALNARVAPAFEEQQAPLLMKQVGVTERSKLNARLHELQTSLRERQEEFLLNVVARQWISESVEFDNTITHDQLLEYYQANADDFSYPDQARWEEIMLRFEPGRSKADVYRELAAVGNEIARLRSGTPVGEPAFADFAKARSQGFTADDGGAHEWTTRGALTAARVDEALFTLPVGQMSPILESDKGFHIVRVLERREAGHDPFTEVQEKIRDNILVKRREEAFQSRIAELRKTARIWTIYDGDISAAQYQAMLQGAAQR